MMKVRVVDLFLGCIDELGVIVMNVLDVFNDRSI